MGRSYNGLVHQPFKLKSLGSSPASITKYKRVYVNGRLTAFQAVDRSSNLLTRSKNQGQVENLAYRLDLKSKVFVGSIPTLPTKN